MKLKIKQRQSIYDTVSITVPYYYTRHLVSGKGSDVTYGYITEEKETTIRVTSNGTDTSTYEMGIKIISDGVVNISYSSDFEAIQVSSKEEFTRVANAALQILKSVYHEHTVEQ